MVGNNKINMQIVGLSAPQQIEIFPNLSTLWSGSRY